MTMRVCRLACSPRWGCLPSLSCSHFDVAVAGAVQVACYHLTWLGAGCGMRRRKSEDVQIKPCMAWLVPSALQGYTRSNATMDSAHLERRNLVPLTSNSAPVSLILKLVCYITNRRPPCDVSAISTTSPSPDRAEQSATGLSRVHAPDRVRLLGGSATMDVGEGSGAWR